MAKIHKSEFIVIKRSVIYRPCKICNGNGTRQRTFRKMNFVEDCSNCKGSGQAPNYITEEVPLIEALKELSIIK